MLHLLSITSFCCWLVISCQLSNRYQPDASPIFLKASALTPDGITTPIESNKNNLDERARRAKIMELYTKGKVNDSQYRILEDKVSEYYKKSS